MEKKVIGILVNDIHLNKDNGNLVKDIFSQLVKICKKFKTANIFCGGDVFTNRSGQPLNVLTDWKDVLNFLNKKNIDLYAIPGNHDKTDKDSENSYLDVYSQSCFHLFRNFGVVNFDMCDVAFIPYFGDEKWLEEFSKLEEKLDYKNPTVLITHMGFDGVRNNDGTEVCSIIKPSMFKKFTNVLIGHYHNASKLSKNVYYTGSAYQNDYGETYNDKGCSVIYSDGSFSHISLNFPKYIKEVIDINDKDTLNNLVEKYENDNNNVRFIFKGKKVDANKVDLAYLNSKGIDAKFEAIETEEAMKDSEGETVMCYDKKSIFKDFVKFCSDNAIKGKHLKYGMELIKTL